MDVNHLQAATTKTARDINRRLVLNLIRKSQPISRAELSRRSRLQRSTISAITEQLIAERWVTEGALSDLPRGRKPTFLHLNGARAGIIGVDIRARETSIALADFEMRFIRHEVMRTSRDAGFFIQSLSKRLRCLIREHQHVSFEGIGVVVPGRVELSSQQVSCRNALNWDSVDLQAPIAEATGLPVQVENVANACALAELWGNHHPEGVRNLAVIVVSDEIQAGMILNGQLVQGAKGMAGDFGHVVICNDGPLCRCGSRGCFEACASNRAAVGRFVQSRSILSGKSEFNNVEMEAILNWAEQNEQFACEALDYMANGLGAGLAMIIAAIAPEILVVVGEVTRAWDRVGPVIKRSVGEQLKRKITTNIVPCAYGVQARLRGAVALSFQRCFEMP